VISPAAAKVSEDAFAEQPALEWLQEVGWSYRHGSELIAGGAAGERTLDSDVVLLATLRRAVERLNPDLSAEATTRAVELALTGTSPSLILDHQDFHELLLAGVPVTWIDPELGERSTRARLIDWEDSANNEFLAVNQLTIVQGGHNRRPDVLLYVNGLPLGQLELKNPSLVAQDLRVLPGGEEDRIRASTSDVRAQRLAVQPGRHSRRLWRRQDAGEETRGAPRPDR